MLVGSQNLEDLKVQSPRHIGETVLKAPGHIADRHMDLAEGWPAMSCMYVNGPVTGALPLAVTDMTQLHRADTSQVFAECLDHTDDILYSRVTVDDRSSVP
jgi:hypothetical protein